jgi:2-polyprenyl-3-methyl-5-hydroxy-6-metoxy-1,4-benzoquinol methylase
MTVLELDAGKAEAFAERMLSVLNMAAFTQYIGLLGSSEQGGTDSYRHGSHCFEQAPRRQHAPVDASGPNVDASLLDQILPIVPGLDVLLRRGIEVLDRGCGHGRALCLMAQTFPQSSFTGYDFSKHGITGARESAEQLGLTNINFAVLDVAELAEVERYDLICTFDALHGQAAPSEALTNIMRALKPDGVYLMRDLRAPLRLDPGSTFGSGTLWGSALALDLLARAGFSHVELHQLAQDCQNYYYVARKS